MIFPQLGSKNFFCYISLHWLASVVLKLWRLEKSEHTDRALTFSSLNMQIIFLLLIISDQVIANHLKRFLTILCNQSSNCTLSFPGIGKNLIKRGFSAFNLVNLNCELDSGSENKKLLTNSYLAITLCGLFRNKTCQYQLRHVPDHLFFLSYRKLKYAR